MRTMALPGLGFGVGTVWTVGGEELEVTMRARWVFGRVWWAIVCLDWCLEGWRDGSVLGGDGDWGVPAGVERKGAGV